MSVVLVTGAQQGIGAAMATAFAAAGADVAINWLDDEAAAERVADGVRAAGRRAATLRADLGKVDEARGLVAQAEAALGPLDVLINNAGIFPRVDFLDMDEAVWDAVQAVNLKGSVFCAQAAARSMVKGGRPGAIVNLTSGAAYRGSPRGVHYCASKGGVVSMTRQMALELAPHRVRVNAIAPGLTDTAQPRYAMSDDELAAGGKLLPLGRVARPDEIAKTAVFLASEEAGFITGQVIHVNGGGYLG